MTISSKKLQDKIVEPIAFSKAEAQILNLVLDQAKLFLMNTINFTEELTKQCIMGNFALKSKTDVGF